MSRVGVPEDYVVDSKEIGCSSLGGNAGVSVLLVGYDKDTITVKGSFGESIGNKGFFKVKIDSQNGLGSCGIMSRNFFPIIREPSPPK